MRVGLCSSLLLQHVVQQHSEMHATSCAVLDTLVTQLLQYCSELNVLGTDLL